MDAGHVRYNGVQVNTSADLVALGANLTAGPPNFAADFALAAFDTNITPPRIDFRMNYIAESGPSSDI